MSVTTDAGGAGKVAPRTNKTRAVRQSSGVVGRAVFTGGPAPIAPTPASMLPVIPTFSVAGALQELSLAAALADAPDASLHVTLQRAAQGRAAKLNAEKRHDRLDKAKKAQKKTQG